MSTTTDALSTISPEESLEGECSVRVYVRVRPLNKKELAEKQVIEWMTTKTAITEKTPNGHRQYVYDACFDIYSTNAYTYEVVGRPVVIKAMEGYNGTVFTYGQTGSGKTWTMRGSESDPGMMILCINDIFEIQKAHMHDKIYDLKVSYMEVYNEDINDLLYEVDPNLSKEEREKEEEKHRRLRITTEDAARGAVIENLCEKSVKSREDFEDVLKLGEANRTYAATSMNDTSSRSHVIYRVTITITDKDEEDADVDGNQDSMQDGRKSAEDASRVSYLNLVDLAGSERQKNTNTTGKTLKEGANINKSLLALGAVINKLVEASKKSKTQRAGVFIPYRDSKLTRILKQSLGGNTLTSILCTISPAPMYREGTVSTLKFGQLCKMIKNQVQSNVVHGDKAEIKVLKAIVGEQKARIEELELQSGGGGGNGPQLRSLYREKSRLEAMVEALQEAFKLRGGDPSSVQVAYTEPVDMGAHHDYGAMATNEQTSEYKRKITELEGQISEYEDERHDMDSKRRDAEEERKKLDEDKEDVSKAKKRNIEERTQIREKETIVVNLIKDLDAKEALLLKTLNEQKNHLENWKSSVAVLEKKEAMYLDWNKHHNELNQQLEDDRALHDWKTKELSIRIAELAKEELNHKRAVKELEDRDLRLQVTLSKIGQREADRAAAGERLQIHEGDLKRREAELTQRDRESQTRLRNHEEREAELVVKGQKLSDSAEILEQKEIDLQEREEKLRMGKNQIAKQQSDLRQLEILVVEKNEDCSNRFKALQADQNKFTSKVAAFAKQEELLAAKQESLKDAEKQLQQIELRMSGIDEKEKNLLERIEKQRKVEHKHHLEIADISSKHRRELAEMENLVAHQSKIMGNYQAESERIKSELASKAARIAELEHSLTECKMKEEQLREEISKNNSGVTISALTATSLPNEASTFYDSRTTIYAAEYSDDEMDSYNYSHGNANSYRKNASSEKNSAQSKSADLMRRLIDSRQALNQILEANQASPVSHPHCVYFQQLYID